MAGASPDLLLLLLLYMHRLEWHYRQLHRLGASPPFDQYQIILLGDRGTQM